MNTITIIQHLKIRWITFGLLALNLLTGMANAQFVDLPATYEASLQYNTGFVIKHDPFMGHLSKGLTHGVGVSYKKKTYGDNDWQILANYPDVGFQLNYYDYGSNALGETLGFLYESDYYLFRWGGLSATYSLGIGFGYHTNPYDRKSNSKNVALAWPLTFAMHTGVGLKYNIAGQFRLFTTLELSHFSMADIKRPNKGANILYSAVGISYTPDDNTRKYNASLSDDFDKSRFYYNVMFSGSVVTFNPATDKLYPVYGLTFYIQKPLSRLFDMHLGLDGFNNLAVKEIIKEDKGPEADQLPDHKRVGVSGGFEYHMNRLSIIASLGRYLYKPYDLDSPLYQRYGIKYYFRDALFIYGGFKSHGGNAENSEFGIGYKF